MAWTSVPVKPETKEQISNLDEKDGRDWDTFLRRELLGENIDGGHSFSHDAASANFMGISERIEAIEEAVDETNGKELLSAEGDEFQVGEWLEYGIEERQHEISGETEYVHFVDFSDAPTEYEGNGLSSRLMIWLQRELNLRGFHVLYVDFVDDRYVIQHNDLILRRVERGGV